MNRMTVDEVIAIWDDTRRDTLLEKVKMSPSLAEQMVNLYPRGVLEEGLPFAMDGWLKKCARENVHPAGDLYYMRNFIMALLRSNASRAFTLEAS